MTSYNNMSRPKTLMELLLAKKIEAASAEGLAGSGRRLLRTDSMDSVSSIGSCTSSMLGEDVCRCDDCLLGIVDLYVIPPQTKASLTKKVKKKNNRVHLWNDMIFFFFCLNANIKYRVFFFLHTCNFNIARKRKTYRILVMRPPPVYFNRYIYVICMHMYRQHTPT